MAFEAEDYMVSCFYKSQFGVECMGCGMQRSLWALAQGEIQKAWEFYPPVFTFLLLILAFGLHLLFKFKKSLKLVLYTAILHVLFMLIHFNIKSFF